MPYIPFHSRFPQIAEKETRTVTVLRRTDAGLPPGEYSFLELFCDEAGCDCRRVFLSVISRRRGVECVIAYGWENRDFYVKWMGDDDPLVTESLQGPVLNMTSPQTDLAPAILDLFKNALLPDSRYINRIKEHYRIFRQSIDDAESRKLARRGKRGIRKSRSY
jgi:hypothetical protein